MPGPRAGMHNCSSHKHTQIHSHMLTQLNTQGYCISFSLSSSLSISCTSKEEKMTRWICCNSREHQGKSNGKMHIERWNKWELGKKAWKQERERERVVSLLTTIVYAHLPCTICNTAVAVQSLSRYFLFALFLTQNTLSSWSYWKHISHMDPLSAVRVCVSGKRRMCVYICQIQNRWIDALSMSKHTYIL